MARIILRLNFVAIVLLISLFVSSGQPASADPTQPRNVIHIGNPVDLPLTPTQEAQDERFRQAFGFNADPAYIASLYARQASGALTGSSRNWGALLTAEEAADMMSRQRLIELVGPGPVDVGAGQLTPFGAYLAAHVDDFAGEFFNQLADGTITVLVIRNIDAHRAALASALGPVAATQLQVVSAKYSYAELKRFAGQVSADVSWLRDHGVALSSFGPDVPTNSVALRVPTRTPAIQAILQARYPDRPWRLEAAPSPRTLGETAKEAPPMMGGLYIEDGKFACASAFVVSNGSMNAVLTAGHCGADGEWFQGDFLFPYDVGSTTTSVFDVPGDVEVIPLQTQTDASHYVYISTTSCGVLCTSHNLRVIQGYEADAMVGELTCLSLVNEKTEQCGSVTAINQCFIYPADNNVQVRTPSCLLVDRISWRQRRPLLSNANGRDVDGARDPKRNPERGRDELHADRSCVPSNQRRRRGHMGSVLRTLREPARVGSSLREIG